MDLLLGGCVGLATTVGGLGNTWEYMGSMRGRGGWENVRLGRGVRNRTGSVGEEVGKMERLVGVRKTV